MSDTEQSRRSFLGSLLKGAVGLGVVGVASEKIFGPDKSVSRAGEKFQEDLDEKLVELHQPFSYENFLATLPEFPKEGSLTERVDRAHRDGDVVLDLVATNLTNIMYTDYPGVEPNHYRLLAKPYDDWKKPTTDKNETQKNDDSKMWISQWLGTVAHLVEGKTRLAPALAELALDWMYQNRNTSMANEVESHMMSLEGELVDILPNDPRFRALVQNRYELGLSNDSGSGDDWVEHLPYDRVQKKNPLPSTPELSWVMLTAAHLKMDYHESGFKINEVDGEGRKEEYLLDPALLVKVASHYCGYSIPEFFNRYPGHFIEKGAHAVQGSLILFGTYAEEIQKEDPKLFEELRTNIYSALKIVLQRRHGNQSRKNKVEKEHGTEIDDYLYGGHLLQAILDEHSGAVFLVGDEYFTAAEVLTKHKREISDLAAVWEKAGRPMDEPKDALDLIARITSLAATDVASTIKNAEIGKNTKSHVPFSVGHSMAGLVRLKEILA